LARQLHRQLHRGGMVGSDGFMAEMKERIEGKKTAGEQMERPKALDGSVSVAEVKKGSRWARWAFLSAAGAGVAAMIVGGVLLFTRTATVQKNVEEGIERKYQLLLLEKELELRRKDGELAEHRKNGNVYGGTRVVNVGMRETLDGSTWTIGLTKSSGSGSAQVDTLTFRDGKVTSSRLCGMQYPTSNYSVTKRDAERVVWETMQTGKNGGVVLWKGEVSDGKMRGVMIRKRRDGNADTFSFVSRKVEYPL